VETVAGQPGGRTHAVVGTRVRPADLLRFLRQLQVKLAAGLSVEKALAALASETKSKHLRRACREMQADLAGGRSLAAAMAGQPGLFDACVLRLVEEGERNRNLKLALVAASEHVQRTGELRGKMRDAVSRPLDALLLILLAVFVAAVALSYLVKEAMPVAAGSHRAVSSAADEAAIAAAALLRTLWPLPGFIGAVAFAAALVLPRIRGARPFLGAFALKLPLLGAALRQTSLACFAWTIGILVRAGVRLDEAMAVAAATANHEAMRAAITDTMRVIESGQPYLDAMAEAGFLRRRDVSAVAAAERRGELATALLTLAADHQREANDRVSRLRTIIHTSVVLVLGLAIALVVLTLYVPIFVLR
jgi:type II secretory pathway component PulF